MTTTKRTNPHSKCLADTCRLGSITREVPMLRYDGSYDFGTGDRRQWTLLSHYFDKDGQDRIHGSFHINSLAELGIITREYAYMAELRCAR